MPSHPKTKKLIRRIGGDGAWRWTCLILWAAANRSDGNLSGMTAEDIELAVDWAGESGQFVTALREVGFIDGSEGGYTLHDWAEHNPWAASSEDRSEKSKWAALCKRYGPAGAAERMPEYAPRMPNASEPHAPRKRTACVGDAPSPLPSPLPSQEKKKKTAPEGELLAGIPDQLAADFKALRAKLRAPVTVTAIEGIRREADKAGLTLTAAIQMCCERGWRGFKASWVADAPRAGMNGSASPKRYAEL